MKLSSGPPSLRTIFRNEKIVPKMSFASSCADKRAGRARAGPASGASAGARFVGLLLLLDVEMGLAGVRDVGRFCCA
jgi:hypothetical protein